MFARFGVARTAGATLAIGLLLGVPLSGTATAVPQQAPATKPAADPATPAEPVATGTRLSENVAMYPRAVRLAHNGNANGEIIASATTFTDRGGEAAIFRSTDDGASFAQVASIPVTQQHGSPGLCCGTLFELPQTVGELTEGTLLYAGSAGQDAGDARRMSLDIWQSSDRGTSWSYLSSCATAPNNGGLWEPEFSVDAQGRLVCHYADETDFVDGTQRLARVVSTDGVTWEDRQITVQSLPESTRPGMPVVRQLPNGEYLMTYEICGQPGDDGRHDCATYLRRSADGSDWGDPNDRGTLLSSETGRFFAHAPTVAVTDDGTLLLVGQRLKESDGAIAAGTGRTVMVNSDGGNGPWREIAAPVEVPDPPNEPCPNYSSALTPLAGSSTFLEIATDTDQDGVCHAYFATGSFG